MNKYILVTILLCLNIVYSYNHVVQEDTKCVNFDIEFSATIITFIPSTQYLLNYTMDHFYRLNTTFSIINHIYNAVSYKAEVGYSYDEFIFIKVKTSPITAGNLNYQLDFEVPFEAKPTVKVYCYTCPTCFDCPFTLIGESCITEK